MYRCQFRRVARETRTKDSIEPATQVLPKVFGAFRIIFWLVGILLVLQISAACQTRPARRVLILNEAGVWNPGIVIIDDGIRAGLKGSPYHVEFYTEFVDNILFPDPADQQLIRRFHIAKYKNRQPDVIVTIGSAPLQFMKDAHDTAFPGVPVVFCLPNGVLPGAPELDSYYTGVENNMAPVQTVELALRLQPNTEHLFVVGGTADFDRQQVALVKERLKTYEGRLDISYLVGLAMPDLLERLKHLPNHSVVLFTALGRDATGRRFISGSESGPMIVAAANAPVFSLYDANLGHGELGGDLSNLGEQGRIAGTMALRILNGERPQEIPRAKDVLAYMFDWRALKRWGFKEKNLPAGSIVLNRQPTVWEAYKWYIIGGVSVFVLQTLLIVALLRQHKKRTRAETILRESEERFRRVANSAPVFIWTAGTDQMCTYVNQRWLDFRGRTLEEELGTGWADGIYTDDLEQALAIYSDAFHKREPFTMEYRLRRNDGEYRWVLDTGAPIVNPDGSFVGYIGSAIDVTDRKIAEEAMATIGGRLIAAQEQERTRIARELHDDINQQMAFLAISLDEIRLRPPKSASEIRTRSETLLEKASEISKSIQALSHQLHSSKLEYFGLVNAVEGFCHEFSAQHKVEINFSHEHVPNSVPREVSLCLFRVMQASLSNALKHSGVKSFNVQLYGTTYGIHLTVRDDGIGFDADKALRSEGIGIISMRERVRFVNGTIAIESKPNGGTTIAVDVPLTNTMVVSQSA